MIFKSNLRQIDLQNQSIVVFYFFNCKLIFYLKIKNYIKNKRSLKL